MQASVRPGMLAFAASIIAPVGAALHIHNPSTTEPSESTHRIDECTRQPLLADPQGDSERSGTSLKRPDDKAHTGESSRRNTNGGDIWKSAMAWVVDARAMVAKSFKEQDRKETDHFEKISASPDPRLPRSRATPVAKDAEKQWSTAKDLDSHVTLGWQWIVMASQWSHRQRGRLKCFLRRCSQVFMFLLLASHIYIGSATPLLSPAIQAREEQPKAPGFWDQLGASLLEWIVPFGFAMFLLGIAITAQFSCLRSHRRMMWGFISLFSVPASLATLDDSMSEAHRFAILTVCVTSLVFWALALMPGIFKHIPRLGMLIILGAGLDVGVCISNSADTSIHNQQFTGHLIWTFFVSIAFIFSITPCVTSFARADRQRPNRRQQTERCKRPLAPAPPSSKENPQVPAALVDGIGGSAAAAAAPIRASDVPPQHVPSQQQG